jgi:hypothetical protein
MSTAVRTVLAAVGVVNAVAALGFAFQHPWALALWPWTTGRLSYIFIGSIFAAIAAGVLWIAVSQEAGSMPAGFLDLTVTLGGFAGYLAVMAVQADRSELWPYAVVCGVLAAGNLAAFWQTRHFSAPDPQRLPGLVRGSYMAFTGILLAVGIALVLRADEVMPWPLDPDTSVVIGWIFVGNAFYFLYGAVRARWDAARAQLWSFLAYDIVLIGPLLLHYPNAPAELRTNVVVYSVVLVYSGALAVWYLLLNRETRGWGSRPRQPARAPAA